jgi:hypothetical protein
VYDFPEVQLARPGLGARIAENASEISDFSIQARDIFVA